MLTTDSVLLIYIVVIVIFIVMIVFMGKVSVIAAPYEYPDGYNLNADYRDWMYDIGKNRSHLPWLRATVYAKSDRYILPDHKNEVFGEISKVPRLFFYNPDIQMLGAHAKGEFGAQEDRMVGVLRGDTSDIVGVCHDSAGYFFRLPSVLHPTEIAYLNSQRRPPWRGGFVGPVVLEVVLGLHERSVGIVRRQNLAGHASAQYTRHAHLRPQHQAVQQGRAACVRDAPGKHLSEHTHLGNIEADGEKSDAYAFSAVLRRG